MKGYPAGLRFGPFQIERLLADHGAMAAVYEASVVDPQHPTELGRRVALKIARISEYSGGAEYARIFEQLLIKETRLLQQLRHPGIVRICPLSYAGKLIWRGRADTPYDPSHALPWYFAMELLSSAALNSVFTKGFPLPWKVELLYEIAQTLDYLHIRGTVHRDLKPSNIVFRYAPTPHERPTPVLIDFGLAEKRKLRFEKDERLAATIRYAPPEWISLRRRTHAENLSPSEVDARLDFMAFDMWSLGIVAYEILTDGRYPFGKVVDHFTLLEDAILTEEPEAMMINHPKLEALIRRMLRKNPESRLKIEELLFELENNIDMASPRV